MKYERRLFNALTIGISSSEIVKNSVSMMITHTGTLGVLTVSNTKGSGTVVSFAMSAGETIQFTDGQIKNGDITIATDGNSTARVIYWV